MRGFASRPLSKGHLLSEEHVWLEEETKALARVGMSSHLGILNGTIVEAEVKVVVGSVVKQGETFMIVTFNREIANNPLDMVRNTFVTLPMPITARVIAVREGNIDLTDSGWVLEVDTSLATDAERAALLNMAQHEKILDKDTLSYPLLLGIVAALAALMLAPDFLKKREEQRLRVEKFERKERRKKRRLEEGEELGAQGSSSV
jgi:hypothetical protein